MRARLELNELSLSVIGGLRRCIFIVDDMLRVIACYECEQFRQPVSPRRLDDISALKPVVDGVIRAVAEKEHRSFETVSPAGANGGHRLVISTMPVEFLPAEEGGRPTLRPWPRLATMVLIDAADAQQQAHAPAGAVTTQRAEAWEQLTPMERSIVAHVTAGLTVKETSERLRISYHTARKYVRAIYGKLDVNRQSALAVRYGDFGRREFEKIGERRRDGGWANGHSHPCAELARGAAITA